MPEVTLDYSIPATVRVNTDTGEVLGAWIHTDDFNAILPEDIFTGCVDGLPEYLNPDSDADGQHPIVQKALAISDTIYSTSGEIALRYERRADQ